MIYFGLDIQGIGKERNQSIECTKYKQTQGIEGSVREEVSSFS
jgi:hypothetical protein